MAMETNIPVVPVRVIDRNCIKLSQWDQKRFMIPFLSSLIVEYGPRMRVNAGNVRRVTAEATAFMNGEINAPVAKL